MNSAPARPIFIKDSNIGWDKAITLEDAIRAAIDSGSTEIVSLLALLPEDRKAHYRALWKKLKAGRK